MSERGKWLGMWTIVRFNWPFYLVALLTSLAAVVGILASNAPWLKAMLGMALFGSLYFLVVSLGISHQVYDRSDLYRWQWLMRAIFGMEPKQIVFCHSGFDEASQELRTRYPDADWVVLDHYDPGMMTEASIRRARKCYPPTAGTISSTFDCWPVAATSTDVIFGLLAIHELRSEAERSAWFQEAKRCLRPGGRVVLAEHTRDLANFVAFGPGFMHFHSRTSWRRCWQAAGFDCTDEFTVTPWVRIFIISSP